MKPALFTLLFVLLSACSPALTATPAPTVTATSALPTPTATLASSATPLPTETPAPPTITPLPTIPTFTPTFDARTIVTATLAPKAECPKEDPKLTANFTVPDPDSCRAGGWCYVDGTPKEILSFLNQGGSMLAVTRRLEKVTEISEVMGGNFLFDDLTNDSMPEFIFRDFSVVTEIHIFTCELGKYKLFTALKGDPMHIHSIEDLNKNGIPEIIISGGLCSGSGCMDLGIYEWNGNDYRDLSAHEIRISGPKSVNFKDYNSDGIKDIILTGERPGSCCVDQTTPWRYKTVVYSWNENIYSESYVTFETAHYQFQSVQDADREVLYGNYDTALVYYQNTIFGDKLEWWSKERREHEIKTFYNSYDLITPTPLPYPKEDPTEYPRLAAYAYYRMVILHTHLGETDAAQLKYTTLEEKFSAGDPGYPYVEMATAFWDAYQSSQKIYDGCAAAIAYADAHREILIPLGSDYHGWQSHTYLPTDVCPFR